MNKLYVFGHTKPDTDSIASAIVFAKLQKALGIDAVAYKLGEVNKETKFILDYLGMDAPELVSEIPDNQEVILVDHNDPVQSVDNIGNAKVQNIKLLFFNNIFNEYLKLW